MKTPSPNHHDLIVSDIGVSTAFYTRVFGMREVSHKEDRATLRFEKQKLILRQIREESSPHTVKTAPKSTDLCLSTSASIRSWIKRLEEHKVPLLDIPAHTSKTPSKTPSVYIRDPDGSLIELYHTSPIKRRIVKTAAILTLILTLVIGSFVWRAGGELACPPRLAITAAGQAILDAPDKHGISIRSGLALDGKVPYLIVEPSTSGKPSEHGETLRKQLTANGVTLREYGAIRGTVVLLHGRMARKENFLAVAVRFCAAGFRCIIPDLPAHGESPIQNVAFGSSDFESALPENLHRELLSNRLIGDEPVCLWGMSMGGAFATSAASRNPDYWRSLIIVSSFDNLETLVTEKSARYTGPAAPALAFLVEKCALFRGGVAFKSVHPFQWARTVTTPTLVFHGEVDDLISIDRGHTLYDSFAATHKAWIPVPDGGHSNVLITPAPTYRMMAEWMIDPTIHRESLPHTSNPPSTALFQDSQ